MRRKSVLHENPSLPLATQFAVLVLHWLRWLSLLRGLGRLGVISRTDRMYNRLETTNQSPESIVGPMVVVRNCKGYQEFRRFIAPNEISDQTGDRTCH